MPASVFLILLLLASFVFIIVMTARLKVHPFFVLLMAAFLTGVAAGLPAEKVVSEIADAFGRTLGSIGIVILCGTSIGVLLERSGAALSLARFFLKLAGQARIPLATSLFGYTVSIPIFCDSGFVLLSPLNKSLARTAGLSMSVMAVVLSSALYSTHCLVPPHPGPTAAVAVMAGTTPGLQGVLMGRLVVLGLLCAVPGVAVGYFWATRFARRYCVAPPADDVQEQEIPARLPGAAVSFIPILLPVTLIALRSFALLPGRLAFLGSPAVALFAGVAAALFLVPKWSSTVLNDWLDDGVRAAGAILAITAAGGSFGAILRTTGIGESLSGTLSSWNLGLFLPFLLAAALKTAQGSSTVAIITASPIVASLLPQLGLSGEWGPALALLALGAGSMVVSHANDSYFWVVTRFSGLDVSIAYRVYTTATLVMGLTVIGFIYLVSLVLPT
ncbi:MAG: GntP family permease [Acidobacteriota bacterium]